MQSDTEIEHLENNESRKMMAAMIASGLLAAHGIDAGGASPELIAEKCLAIADAIRGGS